MNSLITLITKVILLLTRLFHLGSGSTWPGHIALIFNKNFIKDYFKESKVKVILVAGTNGKTTTATMLRHVLESQGRTVFQNEEGANLLNGITSSLIKNSSYWGKIDFDFAIFEVDENTLPLILEQVEPSIVILLNLFRDQLDRYGEVNTIAIKWEMALKKLSITTKVVLNGDDPLIAFLGRNLKAEVNYFGVDQNLMTIKEMPHDVDSIYCLQCGNKLNYQGISYSHLGNYLCDNCGFKRPKTESFAGKNIVYPLKGVYNIYNTNAVILVLTYILNVSLGKVKKSLELFKPVFGRQEVITYYGKTIHILLSKNPTGFNQSIDAAKDIAKGKKTNYLLVLNDRIPDGTDVSWIWDVEFEKLKDLHRYKDELARVVLSGDRVYDMALRLKYTDFNNFIIEENLTQAIKKVIEKTDIAIILTTYTGMLDVRKILTGRKLL